MNSFRLLLAARGFDGAAGYGYGLMLYKTLTGNEKNKFFQQALAELSQEQKNKLFSLLEGGLQFVRSKKKKSELANENTKEKVKRLLPLSSKILLEEEKTQLPASFSKEIRCGTVAKDETYWRLNNCMIARPRFDEKYEPFAGWNNCVFTNFPSNKKKAIIEKNLAKLSGKFFCAKGAAQGFGQFAVESLVPPKHRYVGSQN